jgi:hypothetical protein
VKPAQTLETIETSDAELIDQAILATVAYSDVFDYPLTPAELRRYLVGAPASRELIARRLVRSSLLRGQLVQRDGYLLLGGREEIVGTRRRRAAVAARMWPLAQRYGDLIGRLPFVRMVAVTGALAVDNVEAWADIDYLVVTQPGRLWVCRLLAVGLVRAARLRGHVVCPNYFLAETALALGDRGLYAAHELAQMQPLAGPGAYARMRRANAWADELLPNAGGPPRGGAPAEPAASRARAAAERLLRTPVGGRVERWEMERKVRKLARQGLSAETSFSPEWCKGHFDGHGRRVTEAYAMRLAALGLDPGWVEGRAPAERSVSA